MKPVLIAISVIALVAISGIFQKVQAQSCETGTFDGAIGNEVVVPQNWNCDERQEFWFTDQGSQIIPYVWFLHLEMTGSTDKFSGAANMDRYRYLPQKPTTLNPDGLAIGFTKGTAKANRAYGRISQDWLGMTCAACHTGQVEFEDKKYLIEGAPTMADFERLFHDLVDAMEATLKDGKKFDRFATAVMADSKARGNGGTSRKSTLRRQLKQMTTIRHDWNERNKGDSDYGHARLDALGAIFNETAVTALGIPDNVKPANAPVSYPFIWDTPQHDKVQWNGSVKNEGPGALGRNVGEVLGVFGTLHLNTNLLSRSGHKTSVNIANLGRLEELVWQLQSPLWKDTGLPEVKTALVAKGEAHFKNFCAGCHKTMTDRTDPGRSVKAHMIPVADPGDPRSVGTDPTMAVNFLTRTAKAPQLTKRFTRYWGVLSKFKGFRHSEREATSQAKILGYTVIGTITHGFFKDPKATIRAIKAGQSGEFARDIDNYFGDTPVDAGKSFLQRRLKSVARYVQPEADPEIEACFPEGLLPCYKARPLNGIWATAPYLHNGSVRTMRQLLLPSACPPDANGKPVYEAGKCRQPSFKVGSRQFEPDNMGFADDGASTLDTTKPGNLNIGHEGKIYGTDFFSANPAELNALLEYLKTL